jgi:hypothetical protein
MLSVIVTAQHRLEICAELATVLACYVYAPTLF